MEGKLGTIAPVMGTWTTSTFLKSTIGLYEVQAYFVVYLMPNPMAKYGCTMDDCAPLDNQICQAHVEKRGKRSIEVKECKKMEDIVSEWSEASVFYAVGCRFKAGYPFNINTGWMETGWMGPFSLMFAPSQDDQNTLEARYVNTTTTSLLYRQNVNDTIFRGVDYDGLWGIKAVRNTIQQQSHWKHGADPYKKYKQTCEFGNLEPILPLYSMQLLYDENDSSNVTSVRVQSDFQLTISPHSHNRAYGLMPWIQRQINRQHYGFTLDGPFCYRGDPKGAWTVAVAVDSSDNTGKFRVQHGCIEGLPCSPFPASGLSQPTLHQECPTIVDVSKVLWQIGFIFMMLAWLVTLFTCCCRQRVKPPQQLEVGEIPEDPIQQVDYQEPLPQESGTQDDNDNNALQEPLLDPEHNSSNETNQIV